MCYLNLIASDLSFHNSIKYTFERGDGLARSWIDHVICSQISPLLVSDVHASHSACNLSDHSPLYFKLNINCAFAPTLSSSSSSASRHINWSEVTPSHIECYQARVAESLSDLPHEILSCTDTSSSVHHNMLDSYAEHFISTLLDCAFPCYTRSSRKVVGWNDTTKAFKKDANFWHRVWEEAGCPKAGVLFNIKKGAKRRFKYEVRRIKRRRQQLLRDKLAFSFARKRKDKLWSDIKRLNRSGDSLLAPVVDGSSGGRNITSTFASKFTSLLNKHSTSSRSSLLASVQSSITVSQLTTVDFSVE